jgi:hypothetical protein
MRRILWYYVPLVPRNYPRFNYEKFNKHITGITGVARNDQYVASIMDSISWYNGMPLTEPLIIPRAPEINKEMKDLFEHIHGGTFIRIGILSLAVTCATDLQMGTYYKSFVFVYIFRWTYERFSMGNDVRTLNRHMKRLDDIIAARVPE